MKKALLLIGVGILSWGIQTQADRLSDLGFDAKESSILSSAFSETDFTKFLRDSNLTPATIKGVLSELSIQENIQSNTPSGERSQKVDLNFEQTLDVSSFSNARGGNISSNRSSNSNSTRTYNYTAINCKVYQIEYLTNQEAYTSPDFQKPMYFTASAYIERYIDSKNPGTCIKRDFYDTNQRFTNNSTSRYIAPNGKIYYTKSTANGKRYSDEMESPIKFNNLTSLQQKIFNGNPMEPIKTSLASTSLQRSSHEVALVDTRQSNNDIVSSNTIRQSSNDTISPDILSTRQFNNDVLSADSLRIRQVNDDIIFTSLNDSGRITSSSGLCESPTNPRQPKEYTTFASSRYP
ncbi:MAG: hypothetical protein LBI53_08355 [Candidatus Peribacteria bacterium]|jgi:hypothetical protein|nr:hypothetical protein [Candidatus Peribacteria bacterium]